MGEYDQAAIHLRESLRLLQPTQDARYKGDGVFSLAEVLHQQGHSQTAACLLGAVESEAQTDLWKLVRERMDDYFKSIESIIAVLGEDAYNVAYEMGSKMTMDEALNFALTTGKDIAN
jgi:hypothetical protein